VTTIKDVARLADVSTATVSHVINDTRYVSDELRARVLAAMETLDYRPNVLAQGLRGGETHTIGLVVPDNANPFFAEVSRAVEDVGFARGYSVILCNTGDNLERERAYIDVLVAKQVDGIIFIAAGDHHEHLDELTRRNVPLVLADRDVDQTDADVVLVNNERGGYEATKHLLDLGHRRIGCIAGPSEATPSADRVEGYVRALREADVPVEDSAIETGDFRYQGGEAAAERLLGGSERPTAIFACNDLMAIGALRAIRGAGLSVPDDISVVGYDDIPLASAMSPALTTVAQPVDQLGALSTELLLSRIEDGSVGTAQRITLETALVVRGSSGPPPGR
jgi:LacI family transcriptional regulator